MALIIGTAFGDVITPTFVSGGVFGGPPSGAADNIIGGGGNDTINGGGGNDTASGGAGDDLIFAVLGVPESINGGTGIDTLNTTAFGGNYVVNLATGLTNFPGESFINMENLISGAGNDSLRGTGGANLISGGDGNDTINGAGGNDTSLGGNGDDLIFAVLGVPESINGGAGVDTLNTTAFGGNYVVNLATGLTNFAGEFFVNMENLISGAGNDFLRGTGGANLISGGDGNDTIDGAGGNDTSLGGNGDDLIFAVLGVPELINGGAGVDTLNTTAFGGNYVVNLATGLTNFAGESFTNMENLISGAGNDSLVGTFGANLINGGDGNDTINGAGGSDTSLGGAGNDYIFAVLGVPESVNGGTGVDTLDTTAFGGNYVVNLTTGLTNFAGGSFVNMENLISGAGNDSLTGTAGANSINGGAGNDTVAGGGGNDTLNGGTGTDTLAGGLGNDSYLVDSAGDRVIEVVGEGADTVSASVSYALTPGTSVEVLRGTGAAFKVLTGNELGNTIIGGAGDNMRGLGGSDSLVGGAADNVLSGGDDSDTLVGGGGADTLVGGLGNDVLTGGAGPDVFQYSATNESPVGAASRDLVTDFALGDRFDLSGIDANTGVAGNQAFTFIGTGAFSGAAGELRYVQVGGDTFISGDVNGNGSADFSIQVAGLHTLVAGDFLF